jgi:putative phosphoesterase
MKIAILSDIHANLYALDAVLGRIDRESPDHVIVAGDVVNRGPLSEQCVARILERRDREGWTILKGNHEDFVLEKNKPEVPPPEWEEEVCRHSTWTRVRLKSFLEDIGSWPDHVDLEPTPASRIRVVHASTIDNRTGIYPKMSNRELLDRIDREPDVFCAGHTHVPFVRRLESSMVVNAGAVGLPFDGDPRAAFALLHHNGGGWDARIIRVRYDREPVEKAFHDTGYFAEGGPMIPLILDELRNARPNLRLWHNLFEDRVAAGEITVEKSVQEFLSRRDRI